MAAQWNDNIEVADTLERVADLLEAQGANPFRVGAYRNAARSIAGWPQPLAGMVAAGGEEALREIPGVGRSIAAVAAEFLRTGTLPMLERLETEVDPERRLSSVPGIGEELARRLHAQLGICTLEELEVAAHDGRLAQVAGFGPRRVQQVRELLGARLAHARRPPPSLPPPPRTGEPPGQPGVGLLLEVDALYRRRAAAGSLRRIAPRRFNPSGEAWLPVMQLEREGWIFTVLFSNTARAHQQGATHDWVVVYAERDGHEVQQTVMTARAGRLAGRRAVRGREAECRAWYGEHPEAHAPGA